MSGIFKYGSKVKTKERNKAYSGELMTVTEVYDKKCKCLFYFQIGLDTYPMEEIISKKNLIIVK